MIFPKTWSHWVLCWHQSQDEELRQLGSSCLDQTSRGQKGVLGTLCLRARNFVLEWMRFFVVTLAVFVAGKGHQVWLRKKHLYARHFLHFLVAWHFILGSTLSRVHIYVLKWNFWCLGTCLILHARNLFECRSLCLEPTRITHAHVAAACAGHKCRWRVASCVWATFTHTPATLHAILYIS